MFLTTFGVGEKFGGLPPWMEFWNLGRRLAPPKKVLLPKRI